MLNRRLAGIVCVALTMLGSTTHADAERPPNIVIIMADDMGYNATSVYDGWIKTPQLERLAAQGMKFTDFHSSGAVCSPTRAGLMTGRYQERAGIPGVVVADPKRDSHYTGLQLSEYTLPEALKKAGYTSAIMGKWHLGYLKKFNPLHHGFSEFHGFVSGNIDFISHYDQSMEYDWWDGYNPVEEEGYSTHLINQHAVKFIEDNQDKPFCLYVAHEAVHAPFQGPNSQIQRGPLKGKRENTDDLTKLEAYTQMMTEMDKGVGEILDTLERLNLSDNTLVFFFSDNGHIVKGPDTYTMPLRGTKGHVWEGGHRVPAIASFPGKIKPGTTHDGMFITLDIMPTLLELTNAPTPEDHTYDGISMLNALFNGTGVGDRKLFWKMITPQLTNRGEAMRDGQWKLVDLPNGGLFDLSTDLAEQHDLSKKYPERVQSMKAEIAAWKQDVNEGATPQP